MGAHAIRPVRGQLGVGRDWRHRPQPGTLVGPARGDNRPKQPYRPGNLAPALHRGARPPLPFRPAHHAAPGEKLALGRTFPGGAGAPERTGSASAHLKTYHRHQLSEARAVAVANLPPPSDSEVAGSQNDPQKDKTTERPSYRHVRADVIGRHPETITGLCSPSRRSALQSADRLSIRSTVLPCRQEASEYRLAYNFRQQCLLGSASRGCR